MGRTLEMEETEKTEAADEAKEAEVAKTIEAKATPEKIAELREKHINRYNRMIQTGGENVRKAECENYMRIWDGMRDKKYEELDETQRTELAHALADEE